MDEKEITYVVESRSNFEDTVVAVRRAVEAKGWVVMQVYDYREILASKGFKQPPLKIIEICSGRYANNFLNQNRLTSLCMPCKINVFEKDGRVLIATMRPSMMSEIFAGLNGEQLEALEQELIEIVENAR
jgi:uncharacterized protein (DUF302 family)